MDISHWAEIDANNIVLQVLVLSNELSDEECVSWLSENVGGVWIKTSYSAAFRGCYAGIGFSYDPVKDVFVESENLDVDTYIDFSFYGDSEA